LLWSDDEKFKQYGAITIDQEPFYILESFKTFITHYKIINYVIYVDINELLQISNEKFEWHSIAKGNLSTSSYKALQLR
jgi:hypothetical protein